MVLTSDLTIAFVGAFPGWSNRDDIIEEGLKRKGHNVVMAKAPALFTRKRQRTAPDALGEYGLTLYFLALIVLENIVTLLFSLAHIRKIRRSDILFAANGSDYSVFAMKILAVVLQKPLYFDPHGGLYYPNVLGREQVDQDTMVAKLYFELDRYAASIVEKYIVFTDAMKDEFAEVFGIARHKMNTVYCGVNESRFDLNREWAEAELPDVDILYWGNYIAFHGVSQLADIAEEHPEKQFVCLGDGGERQQLIEESRERGLDNIQFEGFVDDETLHAHIRAADIVCNRLIHNPYGDIGIGNKAAEATYFSKPMLSVGSPAIRELFEDGDTALLVDDRSNVSERIERFYAEEQTLGIGDRARDIYESSLSPEAAADLFLSP